MTADKEWLKRLESGAYKCNACHAIYAKGDVPEGAPCELIVQKGKCSKPCNWTGVVGAGKHRCPRCGKRLKGRKEDICSGMLLLLAKR